jgi:hypothetical protein
MAADPVNVQISTDKKGFFYHHAVWHDVNGDGKLDVVAARASDPAFPGKHAAGELLWLEQPAAGSLAQPWAEHVLASPKG